MGLNNLCEHGGLWGRETNGAFAEYTTITHERALKIPDDMSWDYACHMTAVGSVYHGQQRCRLLKPGASVAILGVGGIGMTHVQFAKLAGAYLLL